MFINFRQAAGFGHVGWGFQLDDQSYLYGATDHLYKHHHIDLISWMEYMYVQPGDHTDWWCGRGNEEEMIAAMSRSHHHIWYHACKIVDVKNAKPGEAETVARQLETAGWAVLNNNCVQQTYEIVKAYGADNLIPDPWANAFYLIPRVWFSAFKGEVRMLNNYA